MKAILTHIYGNKTILFDSIISPVRPIFGVKREIRMLYYGNHLQQDIMQRTCKFFSRSWTEIHCGLCLQEVNGSQYNREYTTDKSLRCTRTATYQAFSAAASNKLLPSIFSTPAELGII